MPHKPVGAGFEVRAVFGLGGDTWKTQIIAELANEALFVSLEIIFYGFHLELDLTTKTQSDKEIELKRVRHAVLSARVIPALAAFVTSARHPVRQG